MAFSHSFLGVTGAGLFVAGVLGAIGGGIIGARSAGFMRSFNPKVQNATESISNAPRDSLNGLDLDGLNDNGSIDADFHVDDMWTCERCSPGFF